MNEIVQEDLSPALTLLRENLNRRSVICTQDHPLCLLCGREDSFDALLLLHDADTSLPAQSLWLDFHLEPTKLWVLTKEREYQVFFSLARCVIRFRDYANAPVSYAPGCYLRDSIAFLLKALAQKHRLIPEALSPMEQHYLPLCQAPLFGPLSPSKKEMQELLPFGIPKLPLQEDEASLALLQKLRQALSLSDHGQKIDPLIKELFPEGSFPTHLQKKWVSVGLHTHFRLKKVASSHLRARSFEDRVILEWGMSDQETLSSPDQCAVESKSFGVYREFELKKEEFTKETLLRFAKDPLAFSSPEKKARVNLFFVFFLSSLLWGLLSYGLWGLFSLFFPILLPFLPFSPLPALLYGAVRGLCYKISQKI